MRRNDRLLNRAFVLALLAHAAALGGAACLPTQVGGDDLADIRVFDAPAPARVTPVELVELRTQEPRSETAESATELQALIPAAPVVKTRREQRETEAVATDAPLPRTGRPVARAGIPAPEEPYHGELGHGPAVTAKAGKGGGPVDLGTPSSSGDLPGELSGGTPMGGMPGRGSGSGSGDSGESGEGSGPGAGTSQGTGKGSGAGSTAGGEEGGGNGFVSRVADRAEPEVIQKGRLEYPAAAVEEGSEGTVRLKVLVTEWGTVAEAQVSESSGDRRLDAAAAEFVKGWRYKPAVQDGKPRRVYTHAVVRFELR